MFSVDKIFIFCIYYAMLQFVSKLLVNAVEEC